MKSQKANSKPGQRGVALQRLVSGVLPCNRLENVRRRASRAMQRGHACPASRYLLTVAEGIADMTLILVMPPQFGPCQPDPDCLDPEQSAICMFSVLESLLKARTEIQRLQRAANDGGLP